MPFETILRDVWATNLDLLDEETFFLAELVFGHLMHHFSTPSSFMTWDKDISRRIQVFLRRVATLYPKVKPTAVIRSMLVVLSIKEAIPNAVAFNDDIELLFMMAFKGIAVFYDRNFSGAVLEVLTDLRYVGTKMDHYPQYLRSLLQQAMHKNHRPKFDAKIVGILKYYLSPFLPVGMDGLVKESPSMPLYVDLERREPAGAKQSLAFPDSLRESPSPCPWLPPPFHLSFSCETG